MTLKFIIITSTSQLFYVLPPDFNPASNLIECYGSGSSGANAMQTDVLLAGGGGGGGAYSASTNCAFPANSRIFIQVGVTTTSGAESPGHETWVNGFFDRPPTLTSQGALAMGGSRPVFQFDVPVIAGGGLGGSASIGVGTTKLSGGGGASGGRALPFNYAVPPNEGGVSGGGGGGCAGPNGAGGAGVGASGGGSNGGSNGSGTTGGNGFPGSGGGVSPGFHAINGSGGGGAAGNQCNGGDGAEQGLYPLGVDAQGHLIVVAPGQILPIGIGPGGGGGGNSCVGRGGAGGLGGGGGGGGCDGHSHTCIGGPGGNGFIVISYTPAAIVGAIRSQGGLF